MRTTVGELAELVGGTVYGDSATVIQNARPLVEAGKRDITLVDDGERLKDLAQAKVAAVVTPTSLEPVEGLPTLQVEDAHQAFSIIVARFRPPRLWAETGVSQAAQVSPSAHLGKGVAVGPGATIAHDVVVGDRTKIHAGVHIGPGTQIGADCLIFPGVVIYENTRLADRVVIQSNAVIGSYGFGYRQDAGTHQRAAQLGYVEVASDVEIGASTTIDRGTYGATRIGQGTKIDNLVQIAHNCQIGMHNLICSQVGIAGSTTTGDYVVMGGQAGIRDHVHLGDGVVLSAMAGVTQNVPPGAVMMGIPAIPQREQKLRFAAMSKIVEMRKDVRKIKQRLADLSENKPEDSQKNAA